MRRTHYLVIILLLIVQTSFGQIYQNMAQPGYKFSRARFDSVLTIPTGLGGMRNITGGQDTGQIRFNVSDSSVYVWNGRAWIKPVGGGTDTASLSNRINLKVNISDTAAMLTPYAKTAAVAAKLNISDTATMLSNYARSAAVTSSLALKLNISDTATMLSNYAKTAAVNLKLNISDTATMLAPYTRVTVSSYGKNAGRDSTILLLSNGTRYAAKDSVSGGSGWSLTGNASAVTDFLGTTNNRTMRFRTNNVERMVIDSVGTVRITNDAVINGLTFGRGAGNYNGNTVLGFQALSSNTTSAANNNTAIGYEAMRSNTTGGQNSAFGQGALYINTTGIGNTAFGRAALYFNTTGNSNTAIGQGALYFGAENTIAIGSFSGYSTQQVDGDDNPINNTGAINGLYIGANTKTLNVSQTNEIIIGNDGLGLGSNTTVIGNSSTVTTALYGSLSMGTIGTPAASSLVDLVSTTKGILIPRMTTSERNAIATPATGLQVYNTTTNTNDVYNGTAWANQPLIVTNRQTANYTLAMSDIGDLVEANVATANTLTVPLNSSVAFPIGTKIDVAQYGAGQTTITAAGGVTIRSYLSQLKIAGQYGAATLVKIGTNEWYCFGNLTN